MADATGQEATSGTGGRARRRTGMARWLPLAGVGAAVAIVAGVLIATSDGGGGGGSSDPEVASGADSESTFLSWTDADPLEAPDCDPETGLIRVPVYTAPNCVPVWDDADDNGGATYQGVTEDTITIAFYQSDDPLTSLAQAQAGVTDETTDEEDAAMRERVLDAFEAHYETYGREVELVYVEASANASDDAGARADAIKIAEEIGAFAVLGGPFGTNAFAEELVARGVVCYCTISQPISNYLEWSPYVWGSYGSSTKGYTHLSEFIAKRLAGRPAEHAGPELQDQERSIGLIWFETADGAYREGTEFLLDQLDEKGVDVATDVSYVLDLGRAAEDARTIIARLREAGATSVIFAGDPLMPGYLTREATSQGWFPEWLITGAPFTDTALFARTYDQEQWQHAFGISGLTARVSPEVRNADPNMFTWHTGEELTPRLITELRLTSFDFLYRGIHLAGPDLTPESFRDGQFAFQRRTGRITYNGLDYGNTEDWDFENYVAGEDMTEIWWDPDAEGLDETDAEGVGLYRYVDGGQRYLPGDWPDSDTPAFDPEGTVLIYDERPAGDQLPGYEHDGEPRAAPA